MARVVRLALSSADALLLHNRDAVTGASAPSGGLRRAAAGGARAWARDHRAEPRGDVALGRGLGRTFTAGALLAARWIAGAAAKAVADDARALARRRGGAAASRVGRRGRHVGRSVDDGAARASRVASRDGAVVA